MNFDKRIIYAIQKIRKPWLDKFFKHFTHIGEFGIMWTTVAIAMILFAKTRELGMEMAIALILCTVFGEWLLKPVVKRNRPFKDDPSVALVVSKARDFSHPSGHSSSFFTCATVLFFLDWRIGAALYVISILMAFSRVYLFVHYPTDVLAGAFWGIIFGVIAVGFYGWITKRTGDFVLFNWRGIELNIGIILKNKGFTKTAFIPNF